MLLAIVGLLAVIMGLVACATDAHAQAAAWWAASTLCAVHYYGLRKEPPDA